MPYPFSYQKDLASLRQNFASYSKIYSTIFNKLFIKAAVIQTISVIVIFQLVNSIGSIFHLGSFIKSFFSIKGIFTSLIINIPLFVLLSLKFKYKNVKQDIKPNLLLQILSIFSREKIVFLLLYILSCLVTVFCYLKVKNNKLVNSPFVYPEGPFSTPQVNETFFFVILFGIINGFYYGIKQTLKSLNTLKFPVIERTCFFALKSKLPIIFKNGIKYSFNTTIGTILFYYITGDRIYNCINKFFGLIVKLINRSLGRIDLFQFRFFIHLFLGAALAYMLLELNNYIFQVLLTQPIYISLDDCNPARCLISGLCEEKSPLIKYYAFLELFRIVKYNKPYRELFINDIDSKPNAWSVMSNECIKKIKELSEKLTKHMKENEKKEKSAPQIKKDTPKVKKSILKEIIEFLSPLPENHHMTKPTNNNILQATGHTVEVPNVLLGNELLRNRNSSNTFSSIMASNKNEAIKKQTQSLQPVQPIETEIKYFSTLCAKIKSFLLRFKLGRILLTNSFERQLDIILNDITLEILAIQILGNLVVASLTEDKYGIIQRDIQQILECLLQCLLDAETFIKNPPVALSVDEIINYNKNMPAKLDIIISTLQSTIYQIVIKFYDSLDNFSFSNKYLQKLQKFIDFKE
ncbi:hypothetical protein BCR32DRAFT_289443 [Anaeromyces robustus]|uniref:Nucleoporin NDC1 n=1 Tax=Anaeromyces robustus TaxID=1754192 RepID=A0A1Y1XNM0_9FUNG|nr:hypothetical protein BCR32DRAFT_289443 [Anaeromyces robustus]|eukprot:ORX87332.1 hypothetical protein BCR32DRAFT_289443 [Anaeromyces robustus]